MKKLKGMILWMGLGVLLSLLLYGMHFCSLQVASNITKCSKFNNNFCNFYEILIQRDSLGPVGYIHYDARGSPVHYDDKNRLDKIWFSNNIICWYAYGNTLSYT
jgi:hypothetical protein